MTFLSIIISIYWTFFEKISQYIVYEVLFVTAHIFYEKTDASFPGIKKGGHHIRN